MLCGAFWRNEPLTECAPAVDQHITVIIVHDCLQFGQNSPLWLSQWVQLRPRNPPFRVCWVCWCWPCGVIKINNKLCVCRWIMCTWQEKSAMQALLHSHHTCRFLPLKECLWMTTATDTHHPVHTFYLMEKSGCNRSPKKKSVIGPKVFSVNITRVSNCADFVGFSCVSIKTTLITGLVELNVKWI